MGPSDFIQPDLSNMERVEPAAPTGAPARQANPPSPNPALRSPLAPQQVLQPDQIRQFYNVPGSGSQRRIMPLAPQANAAINAQATGIASSVAAAAVTSGKIQLIVPKELTPETQIVALPGPLKLSWAAEPEGTVFLSPIPFAGGYGDSKTPFIGGSSDPIDILADTAGGSEVALWFQASDGGSLDFTAPWTNWLNLSSASINAQYIAKQGTQVGYSGSGGGADYAGVLMFLGASKLPTVVQSKSNSVNLTGAGAASTGNFSNPNTAGNAILVFVSVHNVLGSFNSTVTSFTDTHGNTYLPLASIQNSLDTTCIVYLCPVIGASSSNSVTINFSPGGTGVVSITALELNAVLQQVTLFPQFLPLTSDFIPPIDLSIVNSNGGVTGVLGVGNGGTGLFSPGTAGNVLTSNGTSWVSSASSGGVSSVNSQTGAVVLESLDSSIAITTPGSSRINLQVASGSSSGFNKSIQVVTSTASSPVTMSDDYWISINGATPLWSLPLTVV